MMNNGRQNHKPVYWLVMLVICCWAWWGGILGIPARAEETTRVLTVAGQGSVGVETAIAVVRLGVTINGPMAQTVQEQVAQRSNQLIEKLKQLQVEKLTTTGISLNPQYDYRDGQAKPTGVQGQNSVQFEVPIARAGSVLDQAVTAGATQVESVSFRAADTVIAAGRKAALQMAVKDAQAQAQDVLQALNLSSKSIQKIQINASDNQPAPPVPFAATSLKDSAPTPVIGGDQTVNANVTLEISY